MIAWLRGNLFSSPLNSLLTALAVVGLVVSVPSLLSWFVLDADFAGTSRQDCSSGGACWVFIGVRLDQFVYGFYPAAERWRPNLVFLSFIVLLFTVSRPRLPGKRALALFALTAYPVLAGGLLVGGVAGLAPVPTSQWGGLMLTLIIAVVGIVGSLPIGILLALGRRSNLPVVRSVSIGFIELWRGVPLITVLFMASVMLPLFLPEGVNFDKLVRALIGVMLFEAAYMAEVVRGGLQAIPAGQYEAARALGLGYWRTIGLVILPQAHQGDSRHRGDDLGDHLLVDHAVNLLRLVTPLLLHLTLLDLDRLRLIAKLSRDFLPSKDAFFVLFIEV